MIEEFSVKELIQMRNKKNFDFFNEWVLDFFRREHLRETNRLSEYTYKEKFGPAMRQEVSFWNPNRSKHAEVYWLENYVFNQDTSLRNKILNAMAVKFVGMPTLTLVATDSFDYKNIIDFDKYESDKEYYKWINHNLDTNPLKIAVWGRTQLQTSLQTAARNFVRSQTTSDAPFKLSHMIRWIVELDRLGMSDVVINKNNRLRDVCDWLLTHRGIGPYFAYHPPCNFSRYDKLSHVDEDDDYCLVGPGAKRGLEFVFPEVKMSEKIMEKLIVSIKNNQFEFFEFPNEAALEFYKNNLERGGRLTTFGTEITFCQFACYQAIKDDSKAQEKRILPLTFDSFEILAEKLKRQKPKTLI